MITEKELKEAIAECRGVRNPDSKTCIKLASYYTILDHIEKNEEIHSSVPEYSYSNNKVSYYSDTEFFKIIEGKDQDEIFEIMDELMTTLQVVNPRLYASVIRKLGG